MRKPARAAALHLPCSGKIAERQQGIILVPLLYSCNMDVTKDEAAVIRKALAAWQEEGALDAATAKRLDEGLVMTRAARQQLGQYFLLISISCSLLAFGALFLDSKLLETFRRAFALSNWSIAALMAGLAATLFWYIRKRLRPTAELVREFYFVLGGLAALTALVYICKEVGTGRAYSGFLFAATVLLVALSLPFRSLALWLGALAAFASWAGAAMWVWSRDGLFLGMNIPMRFIPVGAIVFYAGYRLRRNSKTDFAASHTRALGLGLLLLALWMTSIFGNYTDLSVWSEVRQTGMIGYAVLFALVAGGALLWGIRTDDPLLRDVGLVALLLNGYTRYFEYFWDAMNKGLFFLMLAVSFFLFGRWLGKERGKVSFFRPRRKG